MSKEAFNKPSPEVQKVPATTPDVLPSDVNLDNRRDSIVAEHKDLIKKDFTLISILTGLESEQWEKLGDAPKKELLDRFAELLEAIRHYARFFADTGKNRNAAQLTESDKERIQAHDNLIRALDVLARTMKKNRLDNTWRDENYFNDHDPKVMRRKITEWIIAMLDRQE